MTCSDCSSKKNNSIPETDASVVDVEELNTEKESDTEEVSEAEEAAKPKKEYVELTVEYAVLPNGEAEVMGYSGQGNHVTIDSEYEGNKVVRIANYAFENCSSLEAVLFLADIKEIGDFAFKNCTALEEIDIPIETTYIGAHAFDGSTAFSSVTVWDKETKFGKNVFYNCPNLKDKPVEDNLTEIFEGNPVSTEMESEIEEAEKSPKIEEGEKEEAAVMACTLNGKTGRITLSWKIKITLNMIFIQQTLFRH